MKPGGIRARGLDQVTPPALLYHGAVSPGAAGPSRGASIYQVTIERTFNASHGLRHYRGGTEPVHDHEWRVWVTLAGNVLDQAGCLVDFADVNGWFDRTVAGWRGQNLNAVPPFEDAARSPSAENVARAIYDTIASVVPKTVALVKVEVEEEPGCRAAYQPPAG